MGFINPGSTLVVLGKFTSPSAMLVYQRVVSFQRLKSQKSINTWPSCWMQTSFESHLPLPYATCMLQMRCQFGHRRWPCFTKTFLWFFANKNPCGNRDGGGYCWSYIQGNSYHCSCCVSKWRSLKKSQGMKLTRKTSENNWTMRHYPKKNSSKSGLWCLLCILFLMYSFFFVFACGLLSTFPTPNKPGEKSWVVQVTSSDSRVVRVVVRCALST